MKKIINRILCRLFPPTLPGRVKGWQNRYNATPTPEWMARRIYNPAGFHYTIPSRELTQFRTLQNAEDTLRRFQTAYPSLQQSLNQSQHPNIAKEIEDLEAQGYRHSFHDEWIKEEN